MNSQLAFNWIDVQKLLYMKIHPTTHHCIDVFEKFGNWLKFLSCIFTGLEFYSSSRAYFISVTSAIIINIRQQFLWIDELVHRRERVSHWNIENMIVFFLFELTLFDPRTLEVGPMNWPLSICLWFCPSVIKPTGRPTLWCLLAFSPKRFQGSS